MPLGPLRDDGAAARLLAPQQAHPGERVRSRLSLQGGVGASLWAMSQVWTVLLCRSGRDGADPGVGRLGSGRVVREKAHRRLVSAAAQEPVQQGRPLPSRSVPWADETAALWAPFPRRPSASPNWAQQDLRSSWGGDVSVPWYDCRLPVNVSGVPSHVPAPAKPNRALRPRPVGMWTARLLGSHSTGPCDVGSDAQAHSISRCPACAGHTQDRARACSHAELGPEGRDAICVPTRLVGGGVGQSCGSQKHEGQPTSSQRSQSFLVSAADSPSGDARPDLRSVCSGHPKSGAGLDCSLGHSFD